jgi:hypothetical protein
MIVWVASFPRSGNRLCRAMLRRSVGSERVGSAASKAALRRDLVELLGRLGVGPEDDPLPALREHDEPVFLKTHSLPQHLHTLPHPGTHAEGGTEGSPALYLVRDGRDCLVSYAHYLKEVDDRPRFQRMSFEEVVEWLVTEAGPHGGPFGGWSGNVGAWRRREAPTEIVRFEDLLEDPVAAIATATKALGLDLPEPSTAPPSIEEMRSRSRRPELVRRGKTGSWRSEFPPDLLDEFWERHGEEMEALGYPRK